MVLPIFWSGVRGGMGKNVIQETKRAVGQVNELVLPPPILALDIKTTGTRLPYKILNKTLTALGCCHYWVMRYRDNVPRF